MVFSDVAGASEGIDRATLDAMRPLDALCQVLRGFPDAAGTPPDPVREIADLEAETILADLAVIEARIARLEKDRSSPRELELLRRVAAALGDGKALRAVQLPAPGGRRPPRAEQHLST